MLGRIQIPTSEPRAHLAALIEDMEAHRTSKPAAPSASTAIQRTPVYEERDPRIEPSAAALIVTIVTFMVVLGGALYWAL